MPWHEPYDSPFAVTLKGVAAGLVGTLAMTTALQAADAVGRGSKQLAARFRSSDDGSAGSDDETVAPTERVAERIAGRVFGTELSRETRARLGLGIYWTYGAFWGAISAHLQEIAHPPTLLYGAVLGVGVWLIGPMRLIPALRLWERPPSSSLIRRILAIGLHVLYGLTTAWTYSQVSGRR